MTDDMQRQLEEALARANESAFAAEVANFELSQIFNNATDGMCIFSLDGKIQRVNDTMVNTLGCSQKDLLGHFCREVFSLPQCGGSDCPISVIKRTVRAGWTRLFREIELPVTGETVPHMVTFTPFFGIDGNLVGIVCNYRDISEQKRTEASIQEANAQLQKLATTDGLTQLLNRRRMDECLDVEWRRLTREQLPLAFIICDVDFFKKFNDRYGHQAGDECLKAVAGAIRSQVRRPADLAARYGGEEFGVVLPDTTLKGAMSVACAIRENVESLRIDHAGSTISPWVSLSIGVAAVIPGKDATVAQLVKFADRALYEAKNTGRNRAVAAKSMAVAS